MTDSVERRGDPAGRPAAFTVLIVLSGLAALVYQVVWTRMLTLLFGVSTYAVATVLGAFMGGLALGAWLLGPALDRARRPLRAYALLEAGIGAYALAFPALLEATHGLYLAWGRGAIASWELHMLVRAALSVALLLPPTFLMGGTLPAMCRVLVRDDPSMGRDLGRLYGFNTLGAAAGALLAGFLLIAWLGLHGSIRLAAGLNIALALAAWGLHLRARGEVEGRASPGGGGAGDPEVMPRGIGPATVKVVLGASAVSGFAALGYEVLWTRALVTALHTGFTYALSLMLATFLSGLVLGSFVYGRSLARSGGSVRALGWLQLCTGAFVLLSAWLLARVPWLEAQAVAMGLLPSIYTWRSWLSEVGASCVLVMLIPTTLMGVTLPLSARLIVGSVTEVGRGVGTLYAFNTIGSVLGSTMAGFLLAPRLGTLDGLVALATLHLLVGSAIAALGSPRGRWRLGPVLAGLALLAAGVAGGDLDRELMSWTPGRLVYYGEDATGIVAINEQISASGEAYLRLSFNGTSYASTSLYARRYHKLLGHLPALLHPRPERALVIAFGTGMTAGALATHGSIRHIDCVELSEAVIRGAVHFSGANGDVLSSPKARVVLEDGRHHLLLSEEPYDLITLEPPPPRHAGIAGLYSRDFYALARSHLAPGGVLAQWIPMHSHTEEEMRMLVRSFVEVFPHATLWLPVHQDAIIVGSLVPIETSLEQLAERMSGPGVAEDMASIGMPEPGALAATLVAGEDRLRDYVRGVRAITDDRPAIEFFAGRPLVEPPVHLERLLPYRLTLPELARMVRRTEARPEGAPGEALEREYEAMSHYYLGAVLGNRGDRERATREWREALRDDPANPFLRSINGLRPR